LNQPARLWIAAGLVAQLFHVEGLRVHLIKKTTTRAAPATKAKPTRTVSSSSGIVMVIGDPLPCANSPPPVKRPD
jgi:hypothetical protein